VERKKPVPSKERAARDFFASWRRQKLIPIVPLCDACVTCHAAEEILVTNRDGKIALFIDGPNLYGTAKTLGIDIDFKRLLKEFEDRGTLVRAFYYTMVAEDGEYVSVRPLLDWLDYNGYSVVAKATKEFVDASGHRKLKGNIDVELAVDAIELARHIDEIFLFSGDGSFASLVTALQRRGVRVSVVSSIASSPPMIASELRRQADCFLDLKDLAKAISRQVAKT
jgi:uncharacterized LabA/DUF88 family protein